MDKIAAKCLNSKDKLAIERVKGVMERVDLLSVGQAEDEQVRRRDMIEGCRFLDNATSREMMNIN